MDKLIIEFESCFWDKDGDWILMMTPQIGEWSVAVNLMKYFNRPVLMFFLTASTARKFKTYSDDKLVDSAMETITKLYPEASRPVKWIRTNWEDNPYARMSYAFIKVGSTPKDCERLYEAKSMQNKVWFAGEASNGDMIGSMHGALMSG